MKMKLNYLKKQIISIIILFFVIGILPNTNVKEVKAAIVQDVVIVNASDVNVRALPNTSSDKLGKVQAGTCLNRSEIRDDGWSCIDYIGQVGYIKTEFLTAYGALPVSNTTVATESASVASGIVSNSAGTTAVSNTQPATNENVEEMVWLSATGNCYHSKNNCGRMNPSKARQVPLSKASGYSRCSKCW